MRLEALLLPLAALTIRAEIVDYGKIGFLFVRFFDHRETEKSRNVVTTLKELREKLSPPLITNQPFEI